MNGNTRHGGGKGAVHRLEQRNRGNNAAERTHFLSHLLIEVHMHVATG